MEVVQVMQAWSRIGLETRRYGGEVWRSGGSVGMEVWRACTYGSLEGLYVWRFEGVDLDLLPAIHLQFLPAIKPLPGIYLHLQPLPGIHLQHAIDLHLDLLRVGLEVLEVWRSWRSCRSCRHGAA